MEYMGDSGMRIWYVIIVIIFFGVGNVLFIIFFMGCWNLISQCNGDFEE